MGETTGAAELERAALALAAYEEQAADLKAKIDSLRAVLLAALEPGQSATVGGRPLYRAVPGRRTPHGTRQLRVVPLERPRRRRVGPDAGMPRPRARPT